MLFIFITCCAFAPTQAQTDSAGGLKVTFGEPPQTVSLTAASLAKLPRKTVKLQDQGDAAVEYEGIPFSEVLKLAKVPMGSELRGRAVAPMAVIAEAADGQKAVFALAEIEPSFSDKLILLADKRAGAALNADEGPWRILVPSDKRRARWLRQVKSIVVKKL
jgi:hypothetical protein